MYFGSRVGEILTMGIQITALLAIPCLTVLAYRGWAKRLRTELPRWRTILGLTSILMTILASLAFISFFLLIVLYRMNLNGDYLLILETVALTLGIPSAFALKSPSRPQILSADLFMILLLLATVNV